MNLLRRGGSLPVLLVALASAAVLLGNADGKATEPGPTIHATPFSAGQADGLVPLRPSSALAPEFLRGVISPRPGSRSAAVSILVPVGSGDDPEGREGAFWLLAHSVAREAELQGVLQALSVQVHVDRDFTIFTGTVPADRWTEARDLLATALFDRPLPSSTVEGARARLVGRLVFEEGVPVRSFEHELEALLLGADHPWSRPDRGTVAGLRALAPDEIEGLRAERYRSAESLVALVGPVDPRDAAPLIAAREEILVLTPDGLRPQEPPSEGVEEAEPGAGDGDDAPEDADRTVPVPEERVRGDEAAEEATDSEPDEGDPDALTAQEARFPAARPVEGSAPAWSSGDRVTIDREFTSTWVAAAFPAPPATSRLELELLAHLLEERLVPSPPDPGLYELRVTVDELPDGPILLLRAAVDPRAALRWEDRILRSVEDVSDRPPAGEFFDLLRRRFRNARLLADGSPGEEAGRIVRELHTLGSSAPADAGMGELSPESLSALVGRLGPPRVLLLGPLDMARPL